MTAPLPVLYERNLRSALPHVTIARRGCLLLCVGRSEAVRARVEDALAARLGPGKVLVRGSLAERRADLWRALVDARDGNGAKREDTVLSYRLGGDRADEKERLFGLNVGRETRAVERLRLLLWLDGFEQLEALRRDAPDLWAVRTDVQFYLSREDFEVPAAGAAREVEGFDEQIRKIDEDLRRPGIGADERILLLLRKVELLQEQGKDQDALRLLDEAEQEQAQSEAESEAHHRNRAQAFSARCVSLSHLGRFSELQRVAVDALRDAEKARDAWLAWQASGRLAHALRITAALGAALAVYRDQSTYYEQLFEIGRRMRLGNVPMFANRARVWLNLGVLGRAEADVVQAVRALASTDDNDGRRRLGQSIEEELLAALARLRGRPIEDLTHIHRSAAQLIALQAWNRLNRSLHDVADAYRRTGLFDDARCIAEQAMSRLERAGAPVDRATWHAYLGDLARDTGDLAEAGRRYELAIEALRARASDAEQAARTAIEEACIHANWADALPPDAAAQHREEAQRLLQDVLQQPVSIDRHMEAHLALGKLHRAAGRFDESAAELTTYRDWARAEQGPARAARASVELARTSLARGDAAGALVHLDAARADLDREEPLHRSRFVQKEILVVRHEAHLALGDRAAAHADLTEALAVVRAEGLRLEELDVIQHLAQLPPADGAADHRLASAHEAAEIAREVLWPAEEARALATLAALEIEAGRPEAARAALEEATWLADSVGPAKVRERLRELSAKLAQAGREGSARASG